MCASWTFFASGAHPANGVRTTFTITVARTPVARLRGLLGRRELPPGHGLLLLPASSIHTCGMRSAIDAVFLDVDGRALRIAADLRPWRLSSCRGAAAVLELPAGTCAARDLRPGDVVPLPVALSRRRRRRRTSA
jgi:uncharacterized membrane protein (UPF0127 family)